MKYDEQKSIFILDSFQYAIEEKLSYAVITRSEDLYHEDQDEVIRALFISRGDKEHILTYGCDGFIYSATRLMPRQILLDIHNVISEHLYRALGSTDEKEQD